MLRKGGRGAECVPRVKPPEPADGSAVGREEEGRAGWGADDQEQRLCIRSPAGCRAGPEGEPHLNQA